MSRFFDRKLSGLKAYTPGEQPRGIKNLIKLNTNESPYPPSPRVTEAIGRQQVEELRLYPDPTCAFLEQAIAEYYGVTSKQVMTGNGSDEVLAFCFHGLCERGAVFPDVTYGFYKVFADMFCIPYEEIPLREDFSVCVEDYAGKKGTVFLANPNAPTGMLLPLSEIEKLLNQDPDRLVVIDEAYIDFGGESAVALLLCHDNLLVVQTYSKSRQMAGGRLGFAIGGESLIDDLKRMKFSFNPYSISRLAAIAGEAAMRDVDYFKQKRDEVIRTREETSRRLSEMGCKVLPSAANFLFVSPFGISAGDCYQKLREQGILVRYFDAPRVRDYLRVTIGTPEQMERFLKTLRDILKGGL